MFCSNKDGQLRGNTKQAACNLTSTNSQLCERKVIAA